VSSLTDADIVELRDNLLPSQGEPFDCIAFARAVEQRLDMKLSHLWCEERFDNGMLRDVLARLRRAALAAGMADSQVLEDATFVLAQDERPATELKPTHATVRQLLTRAALDSDPISVFQDGTCDADSDAAIFVVKGRAHIDYVMGLAAQQRLLTPGKPVVDGD